MTGKTWSVVPYGKWKQLLSKCLSEEYVSNIQVDSESERKGRLENDTNWHKTIKTTTKKGTNYFWSNDHSKKELPTASIHKEATLKAF